MKKTILLCSLAGLITGFSYSQVGINTSNPKGPLHIDAKGDNGTVDPPTAISDDVIVTSTGTVGVGVLSPVTKLDVKGTAQNQTMRLVDGSQADGKMLASINNDGIAKWINKPATEFRIGALNNSVALGNAAVSVTQTTGTITLSPGKWLIVAKFVTATTGTANQNIWIYLKQQNTSDPVNSSTTGTYLSVVGAVPENSGDKLGTPQLTYFLTIPDGQSYRYEIWGSTSNLGTSTSAQFQGSIFYAVRLDENTL